MLDTEINDREIVYEPHEFIKIDFIYFSFSELYFETVINNKMKNQVLSMELLLLHRLK